MPPAVLLNAGLLGGHHRLFLRAVKDLAAVLLRAKHTVCDMAGLRYLQNLHRGPVSRRDHPLHGIRLWGHANRDAYHPIRHGAHMLPREAVRRQQRPRRPQAGRSTATSWRTRSGTTDGSTAPVRCGTSDRVPSQPISRSNPQVHHEWTARSRAGSVHAPAAWRGRRTGNSPEAIRN